MHFPSQRPFGHAGVLLALLTLLHVAPSSARENLGTLAVTVEGIRAKDRGVLVVALYRGDSGWLDPDSTFATRVFPVSADTAKIAFEAVPYDTSYALHDRNENGKMDMRWFPYPKPKEGGGVSNNHVRRGPPEFDKARFAVADSSMTLRITMRY